MIHHISIAAQDPRHVANVLAELWQGYAMPFPPIAGAYIALPGDIYGTAIEVSPLGTELLPGVGDQEAQATQNDGASRYTATHAAVSVSISEEKIKQIAAREGWRAETFNRGPFSVVEFWIENRMLVELLPPPMQDQYLASLKPETLAAFFGCELVPREDETKALRDAEANRETTLVAV
jgi:hypothetical protein